LEEVSPSNQHLTTINHYLYCGEQYDSDLGMYFLRARYMEPDRGRFWTMDVFEGRSHDPVSLHKYLYANADPVNGIDPSGNMTLMEVSFTQAIDKVVRSMTTVRVFVAYKSAQIMTSLITIQSGVDRRTLRL